MDNLLRGYILRWADDLRREERGARGGNQELVEKGEEKQFEYRVKETSIEFKESDG